MKMSATTSCSTQPVPVMAVREKHSIGKCLRRIMVPLPFLLSGGLKPDSLHSLKEFRHPAWAGIDLNSGFEISPGKKDTTLLNTFIKQIKSNIE